MATPNGDMSWRFNRELEATEIGPMLDDEFSWPSVISPDSIPKGGSKEKRYLVIKQLDEMTTGCGIKCLMFQNPYRSYLYMLCYLLRDPATIKAGLRIIER